MPKVPRRRSAQAKLGTCLLKAVLMFTLTSMVMSSIITEVIHMYSSNKAVLITNWTSKHIVSTVNKVNVNSVKCVSITLQSSPRVRSINICTLATRWAFPCHRTDVYCHWMGIPCHQTDTYCHRMGQEVLCISDTLYSTSLSSLAMPYISLTTHM